MYSRSLKRKNRHDTRCHSDSVIFDNLNYSRLSDVHDAAAAVCIYTMLCFIRLYTGAVTGILGVLTQPGYTHYSKESYDQIDGHLTPIRGLHFNYSDKQDHSWSIELFQAESYAIV